MLYRDSTAKLTVRKHRIDREGYDESGRYYGTPNNVWEVSDDEGNTWQVRAGDLAAAKKKAITEFPKADWGKSPAVRQVKRDLLSLQLADAIRRFERYGDRWGDSIGREIRALEVELSKV